MKKFEIERVIEKLEEKRKIFYSEDDFKFALALIIQEEYSEAKVRLEYCPTFDFSMHIDILVIINNRWIPIELKYKTKGCKKIVDNETFNLKNHGAKDVNCYLYLKDIQRIEKIRDNVPAFREGYAIFITNELGYTKKPLKQDCVYKEFSLENGTIKKGILSWSDNTGAGTKKDLEEPIILKNQYKINWKEYSKIDDSRAGTFMYLINKIV